MKDFMMWIFIAIAFSSAIVFSFLSYILTGFKNYYFFCREYWGRLIVLFPQSIRSKIKCFDINGLRHSFSYLVKIKREIPFWELEQQAEFVDMFTKKDIDKYNTNVLSPWGDFGHPMGQQMDYSKTNATTIGNLAYIALHAKSKKDKDHALEQLEIIKDYFKSFE